MDITVVAPRVDLLDLWRSVIQFTTRARLAGVPYITGLLPPDGRPWSMSRAMNAGLARVETPKVLFTPSDYLLTPDHVAAVSQALDRHPWVGVFGHVLQLGPRATRAALLRIPPPGDELAMVTNQCVPCIGVRMDVVADVGGWDGRFAGRAPEDTAFRLKLHTLHGDPPQPPVDQVVELWCPTDRQDDDDLLEHPLFQRYLSALGDPPAMRALIAEQPPPPG